MLGGSGAASNRGPSLRQRLMIDTARGALRVRGWPIHRARRPTLEQAARQEWFRQANWLAKYLDPEQVIYVRQAVAGTPFLPRDLLVAAMAGRLFAFAFDDGRRIYPVAARDDVSQSLDVIAHQPGQVVARGPDFWEPIGPGAAGQVLTSQGPTIAPSWQTPGGGVGLWSQVAQVVLGSNLALDQYVTINLPVPWREIEVLFDGPSATGGYSPVMRLKGDSATRYDQRRFRLFGPGSTSTDNNTALTRWRLDFTSPGAGSTAVSFRARLQQLSAPRRCFIFSELHRHNEEAVQLYGVYSPADAIGINSLAIASTAGNGLRQDTRIQVRVVI